MYGTRSPKPFTHTGRFRPRRASRSSAITTAAPPITGITISSNRSGAAMTGLASTSSMVNGLSSKIAPGVWLALTR